MTTASVTSAWSKAKAGLVSEKVAIPGKKGHVESYCGYSSKVRIFSMEYECYGMLFDLLFTALAATVDKRVQQSQLASSDVAFPIEKIDQQLTEFAQLLIKGLGEVKESKSESKAESKGDGKSASEGAGTRFFSMGPRLGLKATQVATLVEKAKKIWLEWLSTNAVSIEERRVIQFPAAEFRGKVKLQLLAQTTNFFYEKRGLKSMGSVSFSAADFEFFGIKKVGVLDPASINCVQFALLTIREKRAKDQIFYQDTFSPDKLLPMLKQWGYRAVETPEAGDLAVYLDASGTVVHSGVFLSSGKVQSKLGIRNPEFHEHNPFDVHSSYEKLIFFRPPAKS